MKTKKYGYTKKTNFELIMAIGIFILFLISGRVLFTMQLDRAIKTNQYDVRNFDRKNTDWSVSELDGKYYVGDDKYLAEGKTIEEAFINFNKKYGK